MLELQNISLTFNEETADEKKVLKDINLKLHKGEFVTVIGSNGAGKSTVMNIISGSLFPDVGHVFVNEYRVTTLREYSGARYVWRVFQDAIARAVVSSTIVE